jgi:hypothetical protein
VCYGPVLHLISPVTVSQVTNAGFCFGDGKPRQYRITGIAIGPELSII